MNKWTSLLRVREKMSLLIEPVRGRWVEKFSEGKSRLRVRKKMG